MHSTRVIPCSVPDLLRPHCNETSIFIDTNPILPQCLAQSILFLSYRLRHQSYAGLSVVAVHLVCTHSYGVTLVA